MPLALGGPKARASSPSTEHSASNLEASAGGGLRRASSGYPGSMADLDDLSAFVLARLDEDERRFDAGELPHLDEAERHGRIRIMYAEQGEGLLVAADPVEAREERVPVPFPDKVAFLRAEARVMRDPDVLKLVASVYNAHPDWGRVS